MLIYKITNQINNKIYIGQTTRTLQERIYSYRQEFLYAKISRPIIAAMRLYGIENFIFEILEDDISSKEELDEKEKYYIQFYSSLTYQNGYNVELGGNSAGKHSEETKKKISEAQVGEKNHRFGKTGKEDAMSKPIIELTTGKTFESANLAAKFFGLCFSHVCAVARGERGSTGGMVFRYLDENNKPIYVKHVKIKINKARDAVLPEYRYLIE